MKVSLKSPRSRAPDSFSLIELVFAIAIVSFVLVTILGLMAYSSQLVQKADNYARLANVTRQVLARVDSQAFSTIAANLNTNYYTYDGLPTNSASGAAAYYQCTFSNVTPATMSSLNNLMMIQVMIRWPPPVYANTNWVNTSIVNYD